MTMNVEYLIFLLPLVLSLLITPAVIAHAKRIGAVDQPNERKVHRHPVPRLGGIAIYLSFFISLVVAAYIDPGVSSLAGMGPHSAVMLVLSLTLVLLLGIWDDLHPLSPGRKFLGQLVAASIVYLAGFRISAITHPFGPSLLDLDLLAFPLTVLWVVGITNAFNLIDGLDGLAAGVALIVSVTIFSISFIRDDSTTALMALLLAGSLLGFLRYNFQNAKIFLGDSGSLFIGFTLAILSMRSSTKGSTAFSIIIPMLALGLPIMDTILSMIRRFIKSVLPTEGHPSTLSGKISSMFHPDRGHIHHRLVARGLSHRKAVLMLYVVSCLFGAGAFAVTLSNNLGASLIIASIAIATFVGINQLRYREMAILRNGLFLPMYEWPLLQSGAFLSFIDLGFMLFAFSIAYDLAFQSHQPIEPGKSYFTSLALVTGIQMVMFAVSGLYKTALRQFGTGDILKIVKSVVIAVLTTFIVLALIPSHRGLVDATFILLYFFLLLSLVLMARGSFNVLYYLSRRENSIGGRKILVYGADAHGVLVLRRILQGEEGNYHPVGFLDEDPALEGKRLDGYPIFGGHWKLARIVRLKGIEEIVIANGNLQPRVFGRISELCRQNGVVLKKQHIHFEEMHGQHQQPAAGRHGGVQQVFSFMKASRQPSQVHADGAPLSPQRNLTEPE